MKKVQVIVNSIFYPVHKVHNVTKKKNGEFGMFITVEAMTGKIYRTQIMHGDSVCVGELKTGKHFCPHTEEEFNALHDEIAKELEG